MASKKLYNELAFDIGTALWAHDYESVPSGIVRDILDAMCHTLKEDNPRFDRDRFMTAIEERINGG